MGLDASTITLSLRRRYIEGLLFRAVPAVLFALFFCTAASFGVGLAWRQLVPVLCLLVMIALVNIPYWYVGKRAGFPLSHFYVHWAIDLVLITAIVHFLGGIDMPLVQFAYLMMIVIAAIFVSHRTAYFLATCAALVYTLLGVAETAGWLPHRGGIWAHHYGPETRVLIISMSVVFFYVFAYLTGTLSTLLRRANEELAGTKAVVEEQNRLLEQRVKARTQLLEARTHELQGRTDELQDLLHVVTHDLQNVAVATMEIARKIVDLEGAQLSPRGRRYADRLVGDCRLMSTMLRDLLEVVNQTQLSERRELVDVTSVVHDAVGRAQGAVESKSIEFSIGKLPAVYAEHLKIHHVFENLLSNACKYVGDKPNPRIEIGGAVLNGSVEYFVRDNGVGIEPNQMSRIFQLYHRAPDQTVAGVVQQGHGIGLAVVKRIVQRFGGRIWVESVPGEGSSFYFSFPRGERTES